MCSRAEQCSARPPSTSGFVVERIRTRAGAGNPALGFVLLLLLPTALRALLEVLRALLTRAVLRARTLLRARAHLALTHLAALSALPLLADLALVALALLALRRAGLAARFSLVLVIAVHEVLHVTEKAAPERWTALERKRGGQSLCCQIRAIRGVIADRKQASGEGCAQTARQLPIPASLR